MTLTDTGVLGGSKFTDFVRSSLIPSTPSEKAKAGKPTSGTHQAWSIAMCRCLRSKIWLTTVTFAHPLGTVSDLQGHIQCSCIPS